MKKRSEHSLLTDACDDCIRKILRCKYGNHCQICGAFREDLGVMHILGKKAYPGLRHNLQNVMWAGWGCCHRPYDQEPKKRVKIEKKLEEVYFKLYHCRDYRQYLYRIEQSISKVDLKDVRAILSQILYQVRKKNEVEVPQEDI